MHRPRSPSLFVRVVVINGLLFLLGTALLAFSPATVSSRPVLSEVVVLVLGLTALVVANALLVRRSLRSLDRLVTEVEQIQGDPVDGPVDGPVDRVHEPSDGLAQTLARAVNGLLARIEASARERDIAALAAQEAERARIAQELHDGVGQTLTAILLEVGRPDVSDDELREHVRASLEEVRGVARRLRPHVLEDLGLHSALAALTTDLFAGGGGTHVKRGIAPGLPQLDEATELVVFRVAQEALTNVARHAGASTVGISLTQRGDHLVLTVSDDGRGIPAAANGTGIRGMRERAALVGGTLQLGRHDGGTRVTLDVPVSRP